MEGSSFEVKYADFVLVGGGLASATVVETLRAAGPSLLRRQACREAPDCRVVPQTRRTRPYRCG